MIRVHLGSANLTLLGDGSGRPHIGVHGVRGRLPTLMRLPGETAEAFSERAARAVVDSAPVWALLMYRDEPDGIEP